ncbi:MAG: cytochrome c biogenesis protein ResB [Thermoleophilia bacterium]|nr:cytochrome c biogenesis protein ResB [Thermoleophilia bacterium]
MNTEKAAVAASATTTSMPIGKRIVHFLVSMKLALTLLFVIAILCIIGTILPQGDNVYLTDWPNNPLFDFYQTLGLFNMYYSWWFLSILSLLMANMLVCITKRLPTTIRHVVRPRVDVKDVFISNQPVSAVIDGEGQRVMKRAVKALSGRRYRIRTGASGTVLGERGRFSGVASISFHLSFIMLAVGALLGAFLGFDETVEIPDGRTAPIPHTDLQVKNNGFNLETVEIVDKGRVIGYRPLVYSSDLEIYRNGELVDSKVIEVNSPLRLRTYFYDLLNLEGINFHQNSYYRTSRGYVTVLGVNQLPGKNIIYLGFIMMMGGITFGLYFPHRRIWIKVGKEGKLLIGGRSHRSKVSFQRDFDQMITELRQSPQEEDKS